VHSLKFLEADAKTKEPVDVYTFKVAIIKPEQIRIKPLGEGKDKNRFAVASHGYGSVMLEVFNDSDFTIPVNISKDDSYKECDFFKSSTSLIASRSTGYVNIGLNHYILESADGYSKPLQVKLDFGGVTKEITAIVFSCPSIDARVKPADKTDDLFPHIRLTKSVRPRVYSQIMAFDESGNILWKDESSLLSEILVTGDKVVAQTYDWGLICFNRSSGKVLWRHAKLAVLVGYWGMLVKDGVFCLFRQDGPIDERIKSRLCFDLQSGKRLDPETVKARPCNLRIGEIEVYYGYDIDDSDFICAWIDGKEAWIKKLGFYETNECIYRVDSISQNGVDVEVVLRFGCIGDQGRSGNSLIIGLDIRTGATEWCIPYSSNYRIDGNTNRPIITDND
jgi:hypothetical protein